MLYSCNHLMVFSKSLSLGKAIDACNLKASTNNFRGFLNETIRIIIIVIVIVIIINIIMSRLPVNGCS